MTERILVVGSGFAGLWSALGAARLLEHEGKSGEVEIALIAPEAEIHIRPRLYEKNPGSMKAPLTDLLDAVGVRYVQGTVEAIRPATRQVDLISATDGFVTMTYDRLVLATGSQLFRPSIPGLVEHSLSVDQLHEADALERHIKALAALPPSLARNTVVVCGGGFTGIETAAEMPARLKAALGDDASIRVIVVEREADIGPDLGPGPRPVITTALTELGVEMRLGVSVLSVDENGLTTSDGHRIDSKTVIWTAGMRASPLTAQIDAPKDALGRLHVDRNLAVPGMEDIFATGDVAYAATDDVGNHASMSCQHAMGLGRSAGHNVAASLLGLPAIPYSQPKYVTCLDLGPWGAVYTEGWEREVKMQGPEAKELKYTINSLLIYPPNAVRAEALEAADPLRVDVA